MLEYSNVKLVPFVFPRALAQVDRLVEIRALNKFYEMISSRHGLEKAFPIIGSYHIAHKHAVFSCFLDAMLPLFCSAFLPGQCQGFSHTRYLAGDFVHCRVVCTQCLYCTCTGSINDFWCPTWADWVP